MLLTLAIVLTSILIALLFGIPLGILMAKFNYVEKILKPILDAMQTTPTFVYLLPAIMLFGIGKAPSVIATVVYAIPPIIRLTSLGIRQVSKLSLDVADAFGCSWWQKLCKVEFPQALPVISTGINQTTMMALSMVVTSSMIGAKGLGLEVLSAIGYLDIGKAAEAGICIVFLAIVLDRITQNIAKKFAKGTDYGKDIRN